MDFRKRAEKLYGLICQEVGRGGSTVQLKLIEEALREVAASCRDANCRWCEQGLPLTDGLHDLDGRQVSCDSDAIREMMEG